MIVLKHAQDTCIAVLKSVAGVAERRHTLPMLANELVSRRNGTISNGFPEQGGGGAAEAEAETSDCSGGEGAPEVAASDDDGDGDPDSDRRRPRSKSSHPSSPPALLAFEPLSHYVSFGRSRIYQLIAADEFPKPIKVGKSSRWVKAEIDAWISKQAATQQAEG